MACLNCCKSTFDLGTASQVVVHPLVLLSVVDHYTRVAKDTRKRVVGILLGKVSRGRVDVTNSYAVPFEVPFWLRGIRTSSYHLLDIMNNTKGSAHLQD